MVCGYVWCVCMVLIITCGDIINGALCSLFLQYSYVSPKNLCKLSKYYPYKKPTCAGNIQVTHTIIKEPVQVTHTRNLCPSYPHKKPVQQEVSMLPTQETCPASSVHVTHTRNLSSKQCPCYPHKKPVQQAPCYPHKKPVQAVFIFVCSCAHSLNLTRQDSMLPCILQPSPQVVSSGRN